VTIGWEDEHGASSSWTGALMNAFVCNGSYCGGGMCVAPDASMRDGLIDVVIVPKQPLARLVAQTPRLYDGTLASAPGVVAVRARRVTAAAVDGAVVPCDIDGEQPGFAPVTLTCLPAALELRAPWLRGVAAA
jgi:diacylglycerol kinase (ATP)